MAWERTSVDHDQELHQPVVDVARCRGLDDEDVLVADGLADRDAGLLVGVVQTHSLRDLYPQPARRNLGISPRRPLVFSSSISLLLLCSARGEGILTGRQPAVPAGGGSSR